MLAWCILHPLAFLCYGKPQIKIFWFEDMPKSFLLCLIICICTALSTLILCEIADGMRVARGPILQLLSSFLRPCVPILLPAAKGLTYGVVIALYLSLFAFQYLSRYVLLLLWLTGKHKLGRALVVSSLSTLEMTLNSIFCKQCDGKAGWTLHITSCAKFASGPMKCQPRGVLIHWRFARLIEFQ